MSFQTNILTATTTVVKPNQGKLMAVVVNTQVASATIKLYDNASAGSGISLGVITLPSTVGEPFSLSYGTNGLSFFNGLTIVTSGATDVTVIYE